MAMQEAEIIGGGSGNLTTIEGSYYEEIVGTISVGGTVYPRYRRTVYVGSLPNNSAKQVSSGISSYHNILSLYGAATNNVDSVHALPLMSSVASYQVTLRYIATTNKIEMETSIDRSSYKGYVTIEYY